MASPTKKTWNKRNSRDARKIVRRNKKVRARARKAAKLAA